MTAYLKESVVTLVDYPEIPIYLKVKEENKINDESYYTVKFGNFDLQLVSIEVTEIKLFGQIGKAEPEILITD